jgi:acetyl-CoA synthetase
MSEMEAISANAEVYSPAPEAIAHVNVPDYLALRQAAVDDPLPFWDARAKELVDWFEPYHTLLDNSTPPYFKWFVGGKTNIVHNALDRHAQSWRKNKLAFIWEAEDGEQRVYSYFKLWKEVNRFANVLKSMGVRKGDTVTIYMGRVPELPIAMLATAKIGAIHSVVYGGFSEQALADRISDARSKVVITCDGAWLRGKTVNLKDITDEAVSRSPVVQKVVVLKRTGQDVAMVAGRDFWWHDLVKLPIASPYCETEVMDAEDPLFILYTSGSTGKPKGLMHTTGGYLVYAAFTHRMVFDYHPGDVYFCAADVGWITGHSYIVYGPLANGATTVMFESTPTYPDPGRYWRIVDDLGVNIFYTAPTALRALAQGGDEWVKRYRRDSLRVLGSVGEPINPEIWRWYHDVVGESRCAVVDTWWQTETGGVLISPLPGVTPAKPGSATLPFFGVRPMIMDIADGKVLEGNGVSGALCLGGPWPGQARTVWGDHHRFKETYFTQYPGYYFTGDGARRDEDGYYWITGRIDDVLNVSGHRLGTAEVESALVAHDAVAEAAVVGFPHPIKGQGIYAYVFLTSDYASGDKDQLQGALKEQVRHMIGAFAAPDVVHIASGLPKTRSGKIMRRILRKIAASEYDGLGDLTTLAEPEVVERLIQEHKTGLR